MNYGMFPLHDVIPSPVQFGNGLMAFCGCMAERKSNIIRDVSCWLDLNESDGQILLKIPTVEKVVAPLFGALFGSSSLAAGVCWSTWPLEIH